MNPNSQIVIIERVVGIILFTTKGWRLLAEYRPDPFTNPSIKFFYLSGFHLLPGGDAALDRFASEDEFNAKQLERAESRPDLWAALHWSRVSQLPAPSMAGDTDKCATVQSEHANVQSEHSNVQIEHASSTDDNIVVVHDPMDVDQVDWDSYNENWDDIDDDDEGDTHAHANTPANGDADAHAHAGTEGPKAKL